MVYTLTLNPAIDYVMHLDALNVGEIQRAQSESAFFGGKGINVSFVLNELGIPSVATGFVAGFTGEALQNGISALGLKSDFIKLERGLTRINVKIRAGNETDINGNGPDITENDVEALIKKLSMLQKGDILVLAGSIPATLPLDTYERIMASLEDRGVHFVVDAAGELLMNCLKYKPFLIKPNNDELGEIFGVKITTPEQVLSYAERLRSAGAYNVLVSMGAKGAVLLDSNGRRHYIKARGGEVINTVGAGDSMLAGFLAGFIKSGDYEIALRLGTAAGGATAFSEGLATRRDIDKLF